VLRGAVVHDLSRSVAVTGSVQNGALLDIAMPLTCALLGKEALAGPSMFRPAPLHIERRTSVKTVDLIAHRGESVDAPENTLAAFRLAWERGAAGIEGDFRLNADGEIVCMHDDNARRTAGVDLEIAAATGAEVAALDAGMLKGEQWKGEGVPTLQQVLGTIPAHGRILLEIKDRPRLVPVLKRDLEGSELGADQIVVITFHEDVLVEVRRQLPELKALLLTGVRQGADGTPSPSAEELIRKLEELGARGVDAGAADCIDERYVEAIHARGFEFHVWTVDEVEQARRLIGVGVDSITSNRPHYLARALA
jgi:glycerophosphoryl diester phosphodiesterase